jgi:hypothetical protein
LRTSVWALLDAIRMVGSKWIACGPEGPRRIGQCVYCAGPCDGVTVSCETRVWYERRNG